MGLWIKTPDGTLEKAAGADGYYLPLAGGTVTGDLVVGNVLTVGNTLNTAWANVTHNLTVGALLTADVLTVANTLNTAWANVTNNLTVGALLTVGSDLQVAGQVVAPAATLRGDGQTLTLMNATPTGHPHLGMYYNGVRKGYLGNATDTTTELHAESNELVLGGNGVRVSSHMTIDGDGQTLSLMNSTPAGQPFMGIYHNGVRKGYLGNATATTTDLSAETNQLVLGGNGVRVSHTDLQVDGQVSTAVRFAGPAHGVYTSPPYSFAGRETTGVYAGADYVGFTNDGFYRLVCYNHVTSITNELSVDGKVHGNLGGVFDKNQGLANKDWSGSALILQAQDTGSDINWNSIVGMSFHNKRQALAMVFRQWETDGEVLSVGNGPSTEYKAIRVSTCYMDSGEAAPRSAWVDDDVALDAAKTFMLTRHAPDPTVMDVVQLEDDDDGNPVYDSAPHDCATGNCVGTAEHPCVRVRQQRQERYSTHAGWSHAVTPEVIGTQDADGSAENPEPNGVDIGQMAALSLGASGSLARALEAVCWKFGTDLDEVLAEHRAHKLSTVDAEALGTIETALETPDIETLKKSP